MLDRGNGHGPDRALVKGVSLRPVPSVLRTALALLAGVLVGVVAVPTIAVAHHPTLLQRFRADSGDRCQYGYTEGVLAFRAVHPPELPAVDISGTVTDRPAAAEPSLCPDDGRYTIAYFTGYAGDVVLDRQARRVDAGTLSFRLVVGLNDRTTRPVDRLVIEVCRVSFFTDEAPYCGKPQTHLPNGIAPQS